MRHFFSLLLLRTFSLSLSLQPLKPSPWQNDARRIAVRFHQRPSSLSTTVHEEHDENPESSRLPHRVVSTQSLQGWMAGAMTSFVLFMSMWTAPWTLSLEQTSEIGSATVSLNLQILPQKAFALTESQLLVDDVWREVTRQYVDRTFNGQGEEGWRQKRLKTLQQISNVAPDDDQEVVYTAIRDMLATLGDPYTRFLTPDQYASLASYARGSVVGGGGIGVQLVGEPRSGGIVVVNTVPNGPADRAGILPGDLVTAIDGEPFSQGTAEVVAAKCRGEVGSRVDLTVTRREENGKDRSLQISLTRAAVQTSPVQCSTFKSSTGKSIGLISLKSFSQQTLSQVIDALEKELKSAQILVLDLRGNAGGYMPAGVDVAKLFLPPQARVISEVDKSGRATIYINDGVGSDTRRPLYVLVDERSASASEILAAALQDNQRATIVSSAAHTFGKGRIQNVQELFDGSGIAITKAKYVTPSGKDIQGVGVLPDQRISACAPQDPAPSCLQGIL